MFNLKSKSRRRALKEGGSMKVLSQEFKKPLVSFLSLYFLFMCSHTYGLGYLEAVSAAAIKSKATSNEAGYLNKARNSAECNIQYQQAQQRYRNCTLQEAVSPPASGVSECVRPSPPNCQ